MAEQNDDVSEEVSGDENEGSNSKFSAIKKLFSNKIILISTISLLVIILSAGSYFLFFSADKPDVDLAQQTETEQDPAAQQADSSDTAITVENTDEATPVDSQTEKTTSSAKIPTKSTPKSRIEEISNGMTAADDLNVEDSNTAKKNDANIDNGQIKNELMTLNQQVTALQQENKDLQQKVNTLLNKRDLSTPANQLPPTSDAAAKNTSSKPIRENSTMPTLPSGFDAYGDSNYFSSPYADDDQTPEPTWD